MKIKRKKAENIKTGVAIKKKIAAFFEPTSCAEQLCFMEGAKSASFLAENRDDLNKKSI